MMNDRFAADLRQHLLETADERPAEGQLAAVFAQLAVTAQRPPLAARLAGLPGRVGPFPSTAVRWGLVAAGLLGAALGVAVLGGGGAPVRSTVFEGTWTSTDPADGSRQTLVVAAGLTPAVHFQDDFASGPACADAPVKVFTAEGTGQVSGASLATVFPNGGGCGLATVPLGRGVLAYDEATDTIFGSDGLRWFRLQEGDEPPTAPPSSEATPITGCMEIPGGEYGFDISGVVPMITMSSRWHAVDNGFHHLENGACGSGGSMRVDLGLVIEVYADSCHWMDTGVALGDPTSTTAFSEVAFETTRSPETAIAGLPAARIDFSVPGDFDVDACDDQTLRLWGEGPAVDPGLTVTALLFDVGGIPIGVAATRSTDASPAERAELDGILESLRIVP